MKLADLFEARVKGITYTEKSAKGEVQKVIAELKGQTSASWTKISKDYVELDSAIKELEAQREVLNKEIKDRATDLFDVKDEVLTRVVETAKLTITLSRKTENPSVKKVDAEAVVKALIQADLVPELRKIVKSIIRANTIMTKASVTPERLTVKVNKVEEAVSISGMISALMSKIRAMLPTFDRKLAKVKQALSNLDKKLQTGKDEDGNWPPW